MELQFDNPSFRYQVEHQAAQNGGLDNIISLLIEEDENCHEDFRQEYKKLAKLENLKDLTVEGDGVIDCVCLSPLVQLQHLSLSALFCAYPVSVINLPALRPMKQLKYLEIADFTDIDIAGIDALDSLEEVFITFGGRIHHIEQVANLPNLRYLDLCDTEHKNLDFLQLLSPDVEINLVAVTVEEDIDIRTIQRFINRSCEDIVINGKKYEKL